MAVVSATFLAVLAIQGGVLWAMYSSSRAAVSETLAAELRAAADSAAAPVALALEAGFTESALTLTLKRIRDAQRLDQALIVDEQGMLVADASGSTAGMPVNALAASPKWRREALARGDTVLAGADLALTPARRAYVPIERNGHRYVLCLEAFDPLPQVLVGLRRPLLIAAGCAIVGAAALAIGALVAWRVLEASRRRLLRGERLATAGALAASIAHEVKNPLGIILSSAQLLATSPGMSPEDRRLLLDMCEEVRRADDQVNAFLDLARDMPMKMAETDLRDLVTSTAELLAAQARKAGVALSCSVPGHAITLAADRRRLRQALVNIVLNAIECGARTVRLSLTEDGESARIVVADDGPGIPEDLLEQAFEPFVTSKTNGTGLGLATAKRIVERHGGSIPLRSSSAGTTIAFELPMHGQTCAS
ncbi:MAG: HAMP domain-containing histidine kinase [Planctomycetes bacterium]|nr:HAMP domain-containing histidine kinase [Planctomycetota bacterium]